MEYLFALHQITNEQEMKIQTRRYLDFDTNELLAYLPESLA